MNSHVCQTPPFAGLEDDAEWTCPVCKQKWWFDAQACRSCMRSGPGEWRPEVAAQKAYDASVAASLLARAETSRSKSLFLNDGVRQP